MHNVCIEKQTKFYYDERGKCLNTKDNKIQWHPAFDAALRIELQEETKYLTFEPEHLISKKPMQIDILVIKKEKSVQIKKNIGKIFRQYNRYS